MVMLLTIRPPAVCRALHASQQLIYNGTQVGALSLHFSGLPGIPSVNTSHYIWIYALRGILLPSLLVLICISPHMFLCCH